MGPLQLALLQLAIPVVGILWLATWPQRSGWAFAFQLLGTLLPIVGIGLSAIWTEVPQWTVLVLLALWVVAAVSVLRRRHAERKWTGILTSALLTLLGGWLTAEALLGRQIPDVAAIDLAMPVQGNDLMVANGGSRLLVNAHQDVLDLTVPRHRLWTGQAYGIDLVALNRFGTTADGVMPADPRRYAIFGRSVLAPCAGVISAALDGRPDQLVPQVDREVMQGNFVMLRCNGVEVAMAHLQRGSVAVSAGQRVTIGDVIGRVGNSGLSDQPHLHINAQTPGTAAAPFFGQPVAMRFNGRFLARNDRP